MRFQLRLSDDVQREINERTGRYGGQDPAGFKRAIYERLTDLADDPTLGHFDVYPRPIYRFKVESTDDDGDTVGHHMQVVYRVLEDEGAILIMKMGIVQM